MITLLYGQNNYQMRQELDRIVSEFTPLEAIEKLDGASVTSDDLLQLTSGLSLFASQRLVVLKDLGQNKELWVKIAELIDMIPEEVHIVLFEQAPDKRTKTFKDLQKKASVFEFKELDEPAAAKWVFEEAKKREIPLETPAATYLIERAGTNQWALHFALEKLAYVDDISPEGIDGLVEASPQANVFAAIDASLQGNVAKVRSLVDILQQTEDPYAFFGLLSQQFFQLITLAVSEKKPAEVAKDLGVHPYPLQKMQPIATRADRAYLHHIAITLAECDDRIKRSGADPWVIIEQALTKLAAQ